MKTRVRQEERAVSHLANQDIEAWHPLFRRKGGREEALFPGYVFLAWRAEEQSHLWHRIRSTRGVSGFVSFGGCLAVIPAQLMAELKEREKNMGPRSLFKKGQEVLFKSGPFTSLYGIYLCEKGDERCQILLNFLNGQRQVSVPLACIK